jgi:hypothetical protein
LHVVQNALVYRIAKTHTMPPFRFHPFPLLGTRSESRVGGTAIWGTSCRLTRGILGALWMHPSDWMRVDVGSITIPDLDYIRFIQRMTVISGLKDGRYIVVQVGAFL